MIKLINNELNKLGKYKILISQIIFLIIIIIIKETSENDIKNTIFNLIPFVGILCCIFFGGIISSELNNGTFRYYLTKPVIRSKIYISKTISILIYIVFVLAFIFITYYFICDDIDKEFFIKYLKYSSPLLLMISFIIFSSSIFRSTSMSVGISLLIISFGLIISQILFGMGFTYIEYSFLPYLDFTLFNDLEYLKEMNNELNIHLSMNRGVTINIIYSIFFYILGNIIFIKKDIKN